MKTPSRHTTKVKTGLGRQLPPQVTGARVDDRPPEVMSPEHREMVLLGLEEARNGQFATEEEVQATFARFRV